MAINIKGLVSKNAKKINNRAKKIAKGVKKQSQNLAQKVKRINNAISNVKRSAEVVEELALIGLEIETIENFTLPTELNKINNNPIYLPVRVSSDDDKIENEKRVEDKQNAIDNINEFYKERLKNLRIQKEKLKEEFNKLNDRWFGLSKTEAEKALERNHDKQDEKLNQAKNKGKKPTFSDIVSALSFIVSTLLQFISISNKKIEELVNQVNNIISSASTKTDIDSARSARNSALIIISINRNYLSVVNNIISLLNQIIPILSILISVFSLLPVTFMNAGIILQFQRLQKLLSDCVSLLNVASLVTDKLIEDLNYQESRLLPLNELLDANLDNLSADDLKKLISSYTQLGYLNGYDYKGFKFYIKEEEDPKFVVKGNKRRYAVAINQKGNEVLKSKFSFTLDPNVLVEELKLIIDQKDLVS
jgi:hypothetical protein